MNNYLELFNQISLKSHQNPSAEKVNQALLEAEKISKKEKINHDFQELLGNWQLCFITGTKKAKKRAGIILGKGFYLPSLIKVTLNYSLNENQESNNEFTAGIMNNSVQVGLMSLSLSGCAKFLVKRNILVFDFTRLNFSFLGKTIYEGEIRGGKKQEAKFYKKKISQQVFFNYFYIGENIIAARGKGGGLALWKKVDN